MRNHTSMSPKLAKSERGTAYRLAAQMGNTYAVLGLMEDACEKRQGLTLSNSIG